MISVRRRRNWPRSVGVLANEGVGESSELTERALIEKPAQPEVVNADTAFTGDEHVSRMWIPMENGEHENLVLVGPLGSKLVVRI